MFKSVRDQSAGDPVGAVGAGFVLGFTAIISAALIITLLVLEAEGRSSRSAPATTTVVVVDDSRELLGAWDAAGLHGVVLLDATRDTGFEWISPDGIAVAPGWPVSPVDLPGFYRAGVNRSNAIWVGSKIGVLRSVHYLMTPDDFERKVSGGRAVGARGIATDGRSVTANDEGYLRYLRPEVPPELGAVAVLNIDASYFIDGTPDMLFAQLGSSISDYRLVTINRAVDASDVPEAARADAERVAEQLRKQVTR